MKKYQIAKLKALGFKPQGRSHNVWLKPEGTSTQESEVLFHMVTELHYPSLLAEYINKVSYT